MDVFRFTNPTNPLKMEQGVIVNGLKSKLWIERYAPAGEFKFVADVSSGARELLPIGSFVSHIDSTEVMIVENHEINDVKDKDSEIVITGRGFETELAQRIVGLNKVFPTSGASNEYLLAADYLDLQLITLIYDHILGARFVDGDYNNALPYVSVFASVPFGTGENIARSIKRGDLYTRLQELLAVEGFGIKTIRPFTTGPWGGIPGSGTSPENTRLVIHQGEDRTGRIIFSADTGEIVSADYLWSNKNMKNAAMVVGRWVETTVLPVAVEYARRWMLVDASDIDQNYTAAPAGADLANVVAAMQQRGREALALQNNVALTKAEVSKNASGAIYRRDFDVGDLITVHGSYNESSTMQISEYVEIEDETGAFGYPTLTLV